MNGQSNNLNEVGISLVQKKCAVVLNQPSVIVHVYQYLYYTTATITTSLHKFTFTIPCRNI